MSTSVAPDPTRDDGSTRRAEEGPLPDAAPSKRRWYLHPPRLVAVATACFGLLTAFWSVLTPLAEAPDEPAHLGLVLHVADTGRYPAYDGLQHTEGLFQLCVDHAVTAQWCRTDAESAANITRRERSVDEAPPKHGRVRWDDPEFVQPKAGRMNQMAQHPPLYYQLMAAGLRVERAVVPGDLSVGTELAYLRLLNVILLLPLPWLAWCTARRLGLDDRVASLAALLPLGVPQLTHIGGTLNNDNLFVVWVSALMVLLVAVARGDRSRRTTVLVGVLTGLALLTKGFGVVLPPIVLLAYGTGIVADADAGRSAMDRLRFLRSWRRPALALVVVSTVAGWWYLGNLLRTGHVMPSIEDRVRLNPDYRPADFEPQVGEYVGSTISRLIEGFWGSFGWRTVKLPTLVSVAAMVVCLAAVVVACRRRRDHRGNGADPAGGGRAVARPAVLALLVAPLVTLAAFVILRSAVIYVQTGRLAFQQGRYLFGGLTAVAVLVALGAHRALGHRALAVVVSGVVALQGAAVVTCLVGWWSLDEVGPSDALRSVVAWSGWPDSVAVGLLVAGLVPALLLLPAGARWAQRSPSAP